MLPGAIGSLAQNCYSQSKPLKAASACLRDSKPVINESTPIGAGLRIPRLAPTLEQTMTNPPGSRQ